MNTLRKEKQIKFSHFFARIWSHILDQKEDRKHFLMLMAVSAVLLVQVNPYWIPTLDAEGYLSIAKSIATGNGLTRHGDAHIFYAPGYPITISPLLFLFGFSFLSLSIAHWFLLVLFIFGTYVWAKRIVPEYALSVAILSCTNVGVLYYFRRTLSEALFMPLLIWAAIALNELGNRLDVKHAKVLMLALIATVYLCFVRQAGLALPLGFGLMVLYQAFKKGIRWPRAIFVVAIVVGCAALLTGLVIIYDRAMSIAVGSGQTYINQVVARDSIFINQAIDGLRLQIQGIGRLLVPGAFKVYGCWLNPIMLLYIPLFTVICLGWLLAMRTRSDSLCFAFPLYLALYIVWPYDQGCRFMTPFVPLFWLIIVLFLLRFVGKQRLAQVLVPLLLLSILTSSIYLIKDFTYSRTLSQHYAHFDVIRRIVPTDQKLGFRLASKDLSVMARLKLGKSMLNIRKSTEVPNNLRFMVVDTSSKIPTDFSIVHRSGPFLLLQRYPS